MPGWSENNLVLIEEYSIACRRPGPLDQKIDRFHRMLWTQGRKYGACIHATSQRPQLISKDALGGAGDIWASHMDVPACKRIGEEMDVDWRELRSCNVGEFWHKSGNNVEKKRVFTPLK